MASNTSNTSQELGDTIEVQAREERATTGTPALPTTSTSGEQTQGPAPTKLDPDAEIPDSTSESSDWNFDALPADSSRNLTTLSPNADDGSNSNPLSKLSRIPSPSPATAAKPSLEQPPPPPKAVPRLTYQQLSRQRRTPIIPPNDRYWVTGQRKLQGNQQAPNLDPQAGERNDAAGAGQISRPGDGEVKDAEVGRYPHLSESALAAQVWPESAMRSTLHLGEDRRDGSGV